MENNNDNIGEKISQGGFHGTFSNGNGRWVSRISGGMGGAIVTILFIVIPVVNTWLANAKEVSLAQIKNTADQIAYITQRMADSDKERDLYKQEMIAAQKKLREYEDKLSICMIELRESKK